MLLIKDAHLRSVGNFINIVIYSYISSNLQGVIFFPKVSAEQSCIGIINPCSVCSLSRYLLGFLAKFHKHLHTNNIACDDKEFVLMVRARCVSVYFMPNKFENFVNHTCQWRIISPSTHHLKFTLSLRWEDKSKYLCAVKAQSIPFNEPVDASVYGSHVMITEYPDYSFESLDHTVQP